MNHKEFFYLSMLVSILSISGFAASPDIGDNLYVFMNDNNTVN